MVEKELNIKKVLITGGSGFIGTNLLNFYLNQDVEVLNLDIAAPVNSEHSFYWKQVNILDKARLADAIQRFLPTHIFHMAARTDIEGKNLDDYATNIQGVENVIAAISALQSIQRVVFASSRLVCEITYQPKDEFDYHPTTLYGESKVLGEKIVRSSKNIPCPWIIARPSSTWGPWFDVPYRDFFLTIARGRYFHPGNHNANKSYGFVGNIVFQLQKLSTVPAEKVVGKTFYLADYTPTNVKDMANQIQNAVGATKIRSMPVFILRLFAKCGDLLKKVGWNNPPLTSFRLNNLVTNMVYDLSVLEKITGQLPYSLDEGIKLTVDWMRKNGDIK